MKVLELLLCFHSTSIYDDCNIIPSGISVISYFLNEEGQHFQFLFNLKKSYEINIIFCRNISVGLFDISPVLT